MPVLAQCSNSFKVITQIKTFSLEVVPKQFAYLGLDGAVIAESFSSERLRFICLREFAVKLSGF